VFSQQLLQVGHFGGELLRDRLFYPLTGAAATGVIECALHMKTLRITRAAIIHIIAGGRTADWRPARKEEQHQHIRQFLHHQRAHLAFGFPGNAEQFRVAITQRGRPQVAAATTCVSR
jgi:hypothetical protein